MTGGLGRGFASGGLLGDSWEEKLTRIMLIVGVFGCVLGAVLLINIPAISATNAQTSTWEPGEDVADSWGRYNADVEETEPSWGAEEFLAVVEGDDSPGRVLIMDGATATLDVAAIEAAIAGTDLLVVVTPSSPLGAIEWTRRRDNGIQKEWGDDHNVQLIMVHGTTVYMPVGDKYGLFIIDTPGPGPATVDGLLYEDATDAVLSTVSSWHESEFGSTTYEDSSEPPAAPSGRAPTADELDPVVDGLENSQLYVDDAVTAKVTPDPQWTGVGADVKVAVFPSAQPGDYVDYASALEDEFPDSQILVVTGKWISTAGLNAQRALDVMLHVGAVGGVPLTGSAPEPARILRMYSQIYDIATLSAQSHDRLPKVQEGIPRWVGYLTLGSSAALVTGAILVWLVKAGRQRESWEEWRDRIVGTLLEKYVALTAGAAPSVNLQADSGAIQRSLDRAYAELLEARAAAGRNAAQSAVTGAWQHLDEAAGELGDSDLAPSGSLAASDLTAPDFHRAARSGTGSSRQTAAEGKNSARKKAARKKAARKAFVRRVKRTAYWVVAAGFLVVGMTLARVSSGGIGGGGEHSDAIIDELSTSSVVALDADVDIDGAQKAVGTRSLILIFREAGSGSSYQLADDVAGAYPDAIVYVIDGGKIVSREIGSNAAVGDYDVYSLIDDDYDVQSAGGSDPAVQARQLALMYDRIAAQGSIEGIDRNYYGRAIPWIPMAIAIVGVLAIVGYVVFIVVRRSSERVATRADVTGQREALQLRLAETATQLLHHQGAPVALLVDFGQRERLLSAEVTTAEPDAFIDLRRRIENLDDEVNAALAVAQSGQEAP